MATWVILETEEKVGGSRDGAFFVGHIDMASEEGGGAQHFAWTQARHGTLAITAVCCPYHRFCSCIRRCPGRQCPGAIKTSR